MRKHKKVVDWTTRVALRLGPQEFLVVYDHRKGEWDFPGGKKGNHDQDYRATGKRECEEEVGVRLRLEQIELLARLARRGRKKSHYDLCFCQAWITIEQLGDCFLVSRERELVHAITRDELVRMNNFSIDSRKLAEKYGVLT